MPRFTFAAGNAGKLLRLPLYALGAVAAALVPRTDRVWVAGSGTGPGEGALPLARLATERLGPRVRVVWLAKDRAEAERARSLGLDVRRRSTPAGLWTTLRARVAIVTHGFGDVNRYAVGHAFVVQLWHGIPLKRLHLDSPEALRVAFLPDHPRVRAVVASGYRRLGRRIGLFPVASALVAPRIRSAFGVPDARIAVTGDPRDDVLFAPEPERRDAARARVAAAIGELPAEARVVLYAPTWRDGRPDPAAPTPEEWEAIAAWAERTDSVLLVRTHPLGLGDYHGGPERSSRIRLLPPDRLRDLTTALGAVDVLVTDYSSVAFDFSLLERPIVFLAPDVEDYAKRRGLYSDYREFCGGRRRDDWAGALAELDALAAPGSAAARDAVAHARWLRDEHIDVLDGRSTERVLAEVLRRLAAARGERSDEPAEAPRRERAVLVEPELVDAESGGVPALQFAIDPDAVEAAGIRVEGIRLDGGRARVAAELRHDAGLLHARIPLLVPRWGGNPMPLPSGDYRLELDVAGTPPITRFDLDRPTASVLDEPAFRASARADAGGFRVRIEAPLDPDEAGSRAQAALEEQYRFGGKFPEDAVFFESFYSRTAADNPLGVDRALARLRPGTRRYWSVVDHSVEVPEGAVAIVEGSREWWRVRGAARVLVVNDWLRKRYRPRPHQRVLQTWHGTMLKRLALDRPRPAGLVGRLAAARTRLAILRERRRWDVLLAQNPYSERIFRSAYAVEGPIWTVGYPRTDRLAAPDAVERARDVRERLGVPDAARVVLYAPTWRDDRTELVDYLDAERFARSLGDDHVLLVRGHSRTLAHGHDLSASGLLDVTSYPDLADLLLVADVLVTDYSSVMFDWMVTDRPIVFFAPDLDDYSNRLRGFYFDLVAEAPGPLVRTADEVRTAVLAADDAHAEFAERRAAWRERFTPLDDGGAGERVVERMVAAGWFD